MGIRKLILVLALGLVAIAPSRAEDEAELLLVENNPAFRDLTLSVHGRQAIDSVPELRKLNLVVTVRQNTAEVRGRVSSEQQAAQALQLVRDVPGIVAVRNFLEVRPTQVEPGRLMLEPEGPSSSRAEAPTRPNYPDLTLSMPSPETKPKPAPRPAPEKEAAPQVSLQAPIFGPRSPEPKPVVQPPRPMPAVPVVRPMTRPTSLDALLAEPEYRGLSAEKRGGVVYIRNRSSQAAAVMALARKVQDLPDVEGIVLVPEGR